MSAKNKEDAQNSWMESDDFYINREGLMVFTSRYLLKRGYCCKCNCKHCPYGFREPKKHGSEDT